MKSKLNTLTTLSMLAGISIISAGIINFPLLPAVPFMKYDPADIPILISAFMFGPFKALLLVAAVSILQGLFTGGDGGIIGIIMHFLATGAYVFVAGIVYKNSKSCKRLLLSIFFGAISMVLMMAICNMIFTPIFLGVPLNIVLDMMIPAIIPFNILKSGINGIATYFIFKSLRNFIK